MATSEMDWEQDSELEEGEINENWEEKQLGDGTLGDGTPGEPSNGPRNGLEPQLSGSKTIEYHGGAPLLPWKAWTEEQRVAWWNVFEPKSDRNRGVWVAEWLAKTRASNELRGNKAKGKNLLPPSTLLHRNPAERPATQNPNLPNDLSAMEIESLSGAWVHVTL
jgi:hypothetical protein